MVSYKDISIWVWISAAISPFMTWGTVKYIISIYNNLIRVRKNIDKAWANIDVLLKQRHDELPKLIDSVKSYMKYEKDLLLKLTNLRESWKEDATSEAKAETSSKISDMLKTLFARAENYPRLKASKNFVQLQERISGLEVSITDRREFYNDSVNEHNIRIKSFPDIIVAFFIKYKKLPLFQVTESERQDVKIDFSDVKV